MKTNRRGFTLLVAVIVSSVLLALGSAIFDIVSKQVILSSSGRESQFAFFAADTGIECALYWDNQSPTVFASTSAATINCGGVSAIPVARTPDSPSNGRVFTAGFSFSIDSGPPCVDVTVTKGYVPTLHTTVEAYGHNTCDSGSSIRLERAIRVTY